MSICSRRKICVELTLPGWWELGIVSVLPSGKDWTDSWPESKSFIGLPIISFSVADLFLMRKYVCIFPLPFTSISPLSVISKFLYFRHLKYQKQNDTWKFKTSKNDTDNFKELSDQITTVWGKESQFVNNRGFASTVYSSLLCFHSITLTAWSKTNGLHSQILQ